MRKASPAELADKYDDVRTILNYMLENQLCTIEEIPVSSMAWDLVRVVNVARWTQQCGYITTDEMWQIMNVAAEMATQNFASWEEYGRSFAFGRGVWHGDEDDCETAQDIVNTLLKKKNPPGYNYPGTKKQPCRRRAISFFNLKISGGRVSHRPRKPQPKLSIYAKLYQTPGRNCHSG